MEIKIWNKPVVVNRNTITIRCGLISSTSVLLRLEKPAVFASAGSVDDPLIGALLGSYEIKERLGKGGMGMVYRGRHASLDREVAIKVLLPELARDVDFVERFLQEARAAAKLNHPNIIHVYDANVQEDLYYFVMEYVEGQDLGHLLKRKGFFEEREALRLLRQVAAGLADAHAHGIVHRDVKPENLMLNAEGTVKIGDLGLAKLRKNDDAQALTLTGVSMGTPYYISPEQIRDARDIDARADIYSLGMTLFHLLAGKPAFSKGSSAEIMAQHLSDDPPSLKTLNPKISDPTIALMRRMIVKERDGRMARMEDVEKEIATILEKQSFALPDGRARPFQKLGILAGISGLALLFVVILVAHFTPKRVPPQEGNSPELAATPPPSTKTGSPEETTPNPHVAPEEWFAAAEKGDTDGLRSLSQKGANIQAANDGGETALILAAKNGRSFAVQLLLEQGARLNAKDDEGATALVRAIQGGHRAVVKMLVDQGADLNARDAGGKSMLMLAVAAKKTELVGFLLEKEADPALKDQDGNTALILASTLGSSEAVKLLLQKGANPDDRNGEGNTALFYATDRDVLKLLVGKGAEMTATNNQGLTPLMSAAANGQLPLVKALIELGAPVDAKNKDGATALAWAASVSRESVEVVSHLISKGADVNLKNTWEQPLLTIAVIYGEGKNLPALKILLEKGAEVNAKDGSGATALTYAANSGYTDVFKLLVEKKAIVDLFSAAAMGDSATANTLLSEEAEINAPSADGKTALMAAAEHGHPEMVKLLLARGADVNTKTEDGKTALSLAVEKKQKESAEQLRKAGARE